MATIKDLELTLAELEKHLSGTREMNFKLNDENRRLYQDGIGKLLNIQKQDLEEAYFALEKAKQIIQVLAVPQADESTPKTQNVLTD